MSRFLVLVTILGCAVSTAAAGVGDPQVQTDHPWYPGEFACSTFERLAATQAAMFEREVGRPPSSDEDKALAAWMWRNLHYAHGEEGAEDLWGLGFQQGDTTTREYWTGLFAHGFGLCGTTHAQWTAELNALLGPCRSRTVGVVGHNACEVFLTGGPYGNGQWALLDHDVSTVVYSLDGKRLLSIDEISHNLKQLTDQRVNPSRQHGWPLGGLHPDDPQAYAEFNVVEHLPGYAGPPPIVTLRAGESLRRYHQPGLDDGQTFVFWGRNYLTDGIPGPERSRTWINQPERFRNVPEGSGHHNGQARFGNAVYTYVPIFADETYREGVIAETDQSVTFEFRSPYIIAATPVNDSPWGIYDPGGRNGLIVSANQPLGVSVSVDAGSNWQAAKLANGSADLTDFVKGHRQYWLRVDRSAKDLRDAELEIRTVCQANPATFPRLKENGSTVHFAASRNGLISAGPTLPHAKSHVIAGDFNTPRVTLELKTPRGEPATHLYAAAHVASSNPPNPDIRYQIEFSTNGGKTWESVVQDWSIVRRSGEPDDFWSQSFCYGDIALPQPTSTPVQVRFHNDGGKRYLRAEAHLAYDVAPTQPCTVRFQWSDDQRQRQTEKRLIDESSPRSWNIDTGENVRTHWVEFSAMR